MSDFSWDRSIEAPSIGVELVGALPKLWRPAGKQKLFWGASLASRRAHKICCSQLDALKKTHSKVC